MLNVMDLFEEHDRRDRSGTAADARVLPREQASEVPGGATFPQENRPCR